MFVLLALALGYIAAIDRRRAAARWGAAAFLLAGIGVAVDSIRPPGANWHLLHVHLVALYCFARCVSARHREGLPRSVPWLLAATAAAVEAANIAGSLETRMLLFHAGVVLALSPLAIASIGWARRSSVDRLVAASLTLAAASYLLRLLLLLDDPLPSTLIHASSFFSIRINILFHLIMALSGTMMGMAMIIALGHDMLARQRHRSATDALTRLGNRYALEETIDDDASGLWRCGGVISIDLDRFKLVNDRHGHSAGDAVLVATSAALAASLGAAGRLCRVGGEEFVLLANHSVRQELAALAEAARAAIAAIDFPLTKDGVSPTASLGYCQRIDDEPIETLLREADIALYRAKAEGRNRAIAAR